MVLKWKVNAIDMKYLSIKGKEKRQNKKWYNSETTESRPIEKNPLKWKVKLIRRKRRGFTKKMRNT